MATLDVGRKRYHLLNSSLVKGARPELLQAISDVVDSKFLDTVAAIALDRRYTSLLFVLLEDEFADICARWLTTSNDSPVDFRIISAFARILPFAPYLSVYLERYLCLNQPGDFSVVVDTCPPTNDESLIILLLATWRLINFDQRMYWRLISPSIVQGGLSHHAAAVRFLSTRIFCFLLALSDARMELLIEKTCSHQDTSMTADCDGQLIHFRFLSIHEQRRARELLSWRRIRDQENKTMDGDVMSSSLQPLTPYVVKYGRVILPRPLGPVEASSSLVMTPTTVKNMENLAKMLQKPGPILLHGLPGVGKTAAIHDIARQLSAEHGMLSLHLNEQTDAKMLIGLYATDARPGTFNWRPGVLTTAVKEGRWVLIEDLDRAPNEVMSTLLPLVERGELLIPSRGETIRAASSFRLFATVRTSLSISGSEIVPSLMGIRFWQQLPVHMPLPEEMGDIIQELYPTLKPYVPEILRVYGKICSISRSIPASRGLLERQASLRDLFKWCRRRNQILQTAGCRSGEEPVSDTLRDWMFKEAVDCFVGSVPNDFLRQALIHGIAKEMHRAPELVNQMLAREIPIIEETDRQMVVGRTVLPKLGRSSRTPKSKKLFATTTHAKRLLEQIATAVKLREPVLLVGETGIGKTAVIQQIAESLGHKLIAVNLSQQSEVADLLGGFKPVNIRSLALPLKEEFEDLFAAMRISESETNQKFFQNLNKFTVKGQWTKLSKLLRQGPNIFAQTLDKQYKKAAEESASSPGGEKPAKRRKVETTLQRLVDLEPRWNSFEEKLDQLDVQLSGGASGFAFSFMEGKIVKSARNGDWILLDEINLASSDTLESIADLFQSVPDGNPSILLPETGKIERIKAHPGFRVFAAMNPATDIGKRDLPVGIRSRFTEIYVGSPDRDLKDLLDIISIYLRRANIRDDKAVDDIARLYLETKKLAAGKRLVDGANEVPHFSLRTLTRVLIYVGDIAPFYGLRRSLYEGFSMGFLTLLDKKSEDLLTPIIHEYLFSKFGGAKKVLSVPAKRPQDGRVHVEFINKSKDRHYWLLRGREAPVQRPDYIITPHVERNLLNLVRATSTRRFPILIQGPTSSGKTSMIQYLAEYSGNKFVRINNHEHTDIQEYLGTYVSGSGGKLHFQEGLLVQAMRQGYWIVLDELNLAPTDVLEALNRLLDDNRELLIPETQEVVRPHESFMLFATQNPPGLYGGRKVLSRAFRNRFLELHFDDIPEDELEFILQQRARNTSPSDCRRIVSVYKELSRLRQTTRLFEQKDSFATLRDLFRWALREADFREGIAAQGFMLLAERVRNSEERDTVREVIENEFKVKIDPEVLYDASASLDLKHATSLENKHGVVWTYAMRRLYVLLVNALRNNEPVLLVGETGCGKTTVCQLLADVVGKELHIVNAHQNIETGDLVGSQRPVRNRGAILNALHADIAWVFQHLGLPSHDNSENLMARFRSLEPEVLAAVPAGIRERIDANETRSKALFEWCDGSLVHAMRNGQFFLLDEISLADDSVLERLNSVLEPHRSLVLAEKGVNNSLVRAADGFQFLATMNPGGDFGKKELSPALRNRFTEIWVPPMNDSRDVIEIVKAKLPTSLHGVADRIVDFSFWFGQEFRSTSSTAFSIRDVLTWVQFISDAENGHVQLRVLNGAATAFIDTLGANPSALMTLDAETIDAQRQKCLRKLSELFADDFVSLYRVQPNFKVSFDSIAIGGFHIPRGPRATQDVGFSFEAPTTRLNAMRVARALQVQKPLLLEGNPGVGKTTLISALAQASGRPLTRINLSDQTDLMDLFGTDVPTEGAEVGNFAWRDAPFLQAMQKGEWVLLDEMNLASQSVLEGLNACLDHRGEVYIAELDQVFKRHPDFCLFAAQNPHYQGGGRKGLPSSFVNRFVVVYCDELTEQDLYLIATHNFPAFDPVMVKTLIKFISALRNKVGAEKAFGAQGSPWELNLRDILRWLKLATSRKLLPSDHRVHELLDIVVRQRFRTPKDRETTTKLFCECVKKFSEHSDINIEHSLYYSTTPLMAQVGMALLPRNEIVQPTRFPQINIISRLAEIESVLICVRENIPVILTGSSGCGKTILLQHVAALAGKHLVMFPLNADVDTMDLVGGFEHADPLRGFNSILGNIVGPLQEVVLRNVMNETDRSMLDLFFSIRAYMQGQAQLGDLLPLLEAAKTHALANDMGLSLLSSALQATSSTASMSPRFEWLDGVIVKAVEQGQWLVLDNANLCNASVLDRLNSLLEPNGFLSVNEHCGPGGEPRIVRPHPDFRIFLTMDPRYGELSRAMRNRAIEIYVDVVPFERLEHMTRIAAVESSLDRFWCAESMKTQDERLVELGFEILVLADLPLVQSYDPSDQQQVRALDGLSGILKRQGNIERLNQLYSRLDSFNASLARYQPIHPLQNEALISLLCGAPNDAPYRVATYLEGLRAIDARYKRLEVSSVGCGPLAHRTRLQRSAMPTKNIIVAQDSTVNVHRFLRGVLQHTQAILQITLTGGGHWTVYQDIINHLLVFWYRTFQEASVEHSKFDEARFQAHLNHGRRTLTKHLFPLIPALDPATEHLNSVSGSLAEDFRAGFQLNFGHSMEIIWNHLRPYPIKSETALGHISELEALANRFDDLRWKTRSRLAELSHVVSKLTEVYCEVRCRDADAVELIANFSKEINALEARVVEGVPEHLPVLAEEFDYLRQTVAFQATADGNIPFQCPPQLIVLSNHPSVSYMALRSAPDSAAALQTLDFILQQGHDAGPWKGRFSAPILNKLMSSNSMSLASLKSLETELPAMALAAVANSKAITSNHLAKASDLAIKLISDLMSYHDPSVREFWNVKASGDFFCEPDLGKYLEEGATVSEHFLGEIKLLLSRLPSKKSSQVAQLPAYGALLWAGMAVSMINMYVPDKPFDPRLRPLMEREYQAEFQSAAKEAQFLKDFQQLFTGQMGSIRRTAILNMLERNKEEVADMVECYRPPQSELGRLQAEFTSIHTSVKSNIIKLFDKANFCLSRNCPVVKGEVVKELLEGPKENVIKIIDRLSLGYKAYQDLTIPAKNMLRCLQVAISLAELRVPNRDDFGPCCLVPTMGGKLWEAEKYQDLLKEQWVQGRELDFLLFLEVTVSIEGLGGLSGEQRISIDQVFSSIYQQWSRKLEIDRQIQQANQSLYRFKGSVQDEEEFDEKEFNDMFPTYESEEAVRPTIRRRDITLRVAEMHSRIFTSRRTSQDTLSALAISAGRQVEPVPDATMDGRLFTAALLAMDKKVDELQSGSVPAGYNFYTDANLAESLRLVQLVTETQVRFRALQLVDEISHLMPLSNVVEACDKVLRLNHDDPLAKVIPRVENLHKYVYEWQFGGWAPRQYAVLPLYNRLTDLLVCWRRLELSTWSKMLDFELKRCQEETMSWWFIAYGPVIEEPMALAATGSELTSHATKLIAHLEQYFISSTIGQFLMRLDLIRQLQKHLEMLVIGTPQLTLILHPLQNFIEISSNFEAPVQEAIRAGRAPLEKQMKDVLLLASWRDTNIAALRESARKSHLKLFKIVQKFRKVLDQPVKVIIEQGIPEAVVPAVIKPSHVASVQDLSIDAVTRCQSIPYWADANRRLVNASKTVRIMAQIASFGDSIEAAELVASAGADLRDSISRLREETPNTLTEENKKKVNHLKTRKRRLFADILKLVRQMGFRFNLGTDRLTTQGSLPNVLSRAGYISRKDLPGAKKAVYYTHRILDLMPKVRQSVYKHSKDLTGPEVARSVGFLEGILDVVLTQHQALSAAIHDLKELEETVSYASSIGSIAVEDSDPEFSASYHRQLAWGEATLAFVRRLIETHAKLGGISATYVLSQVDSWSREFARLRAEEEEMRRLPKNMATPVQNKARMCWIGERFSQLNAEVRSCAEKREDLAWALTGMIEFLSIPIKSGAAVQVQNIGVHELSKEVSDVSNKALVVMEKLKNAKNELPSSYQDPGWLSRYNSVMETCMTVLHMEEVTSSIQQLFSMFAHTDSDAKEVFPSLIATTVPILMQYSRVCRHMLEKFAELHGSICEMGFILAKSFNHLAFQGFCTPQEDSAETSKESGKLEDGTGLGDEKGAEDISKDIQADEDLSELAQQPQEERQDDKDEIKGEKDAVDMADEELEGEMGDKEVDEDDNDGNKDEDEEEDAISEEADNVDDLDPSAVDEKMWDEEAEKGDKEQKGDKEMGRKGNEEQAVDKEVEKQDLKAQEVENDDGSEDEDEEGDGEEGVEEQDVKPQVDTDRQDQNVQQETALDLPDDMDLDGGDEKSISESENDIENLDDGEGEAARSQKEDGEDEEMIDAADVPDQKEEDAPDAEEARNKGRPDSEEEKGDEPQDDGESMQGDDEAVDEDEADKRDYARRPNYQTTADQENVAPSDSQEGCGLDQSKDQSELDENFQAPPTQQEDGNVWQGETQEQSMAGNDGCVSRSAETIEEHAQREQEQEITQPFKKLGDALENWYRRHKDILAAPKDKQESILPQVEVDKQEFQHVQDEIVEEDAQALGDAKEEDVRPFDDSMAIDEDENKGPQLLCVEEDDQEDVQLEDKMDADESHKPREEKDKLDESEACNGAAIQKGSFNLADPVVENGEHGNEEVEEEEEAVADVDETSAQLSAAHMAGPVLDQVDFGEALHQWSRFQAKTHGLSLNLTSQLRLILTPSHATKLSGAYRTGKRLNIKRIIPYIASGYKRDKIWMRRAVPTKRAYQVLVAVDDSESMKGFTTTNPTMNDTKSSTSLHPSSPAYMALESLVMIARSLSMLEVGQVGILGFGKETFVAHSLLSDPPLTSSEVGARALGKFSFAQGHTDVFGLLRRTVDIFVEARNLKSSGVGRAGGSGGGDDLWQLAIVLSDGLASTGSFDGIRRLLREAAEKRIMVVFIVLDTSALAPSSPCFPAPAPVAPDSGNSNSRSNNNSKLPLHGASIVNLKQAKVERDEEGNTVIKVERYLDSFPFGYYLIVREMVELPNALAGLLRQWFGEVDGG